ncbi:hypothetical protein TRIP_B330082 [uncultured Desulfatiglans sp.]|uniref:Uncharacterized protein n=1 Tax=Uncultured Desulfatiglans sp. TaxID=1748965 RepID=A0A653A7G6_UNCDX|nr:hypothetical protein TRIP_B330082 [uncultured Desulfatiglans sp.]
MRCLRRAALHLPKGALILPGRGGMTERRGIPLFFSLHPGERPVHEGLSSTRTRCFCIAEREGGSGRF